MGLQVLLGRRVLYLPSSALCRADRALLLQGNLTGGPFLERRKETSQDLPEACLVASCSHGVFFNGTSSRLPANRLDGNM